MLHMFIKGFGIVLVLFAVACGGGSEKKTVSEQKISKGNIDIDDLPSAGTVGFILADGQYYYFSKPGAVNTSINHIYDGKAYGFYSNTEDGSFAGFTLDLKTLEFSEIVTTGNRFFVVRGGFENDLIGKLADNSGTPTNSEDDISKGFLYDLKTQNINSVTRENYNDIGFTSMNKEGVITGFNDFGTKGFLLIDDNYIDLTHQDAYRLFPFQINKNGKFVGFWGITEDTWYDNSINPSFIGNYSNNSYTIEKYELPGYTGVGLAGINDKGEIAGIAYKSTSDYPEVIYAADETSIPKVFALSSHLEPFVTGITNDGLIYGQIFLHEPEATDDINETDASVLLKNSEEILKTAQSLNTVAHSGDISSIIHSAFHELESPAVGLNNRAKELDEIFSLADKNEEIQSLLIDGLWIRLRKIEDATNSIQSLIQNSAVSSSNDANTAYEVIEAIFPLINEMREKIISTAVKYQGEIYDEITNIEGALNPQKLLNGNILVALSTDNRVVELTFDGTVAWHYNIAFPTVARRLENGNTLIASKTSGKVIELNVNNEIVWEYLGKNIYGVERLGNGNTIITIQGGNPTQLVEIDQNGIEVWKYVGTLVAPSCKKLENGNILIADNSDYSIGKAKVFEVTTSGEVVWEYSDNIYGIYGVDRLENGNTLINDQGNGRFIEVTSDKKIVWSYGALNLPGGFQLLENGDLLVAVFGENRLFTITKE